MSETKTIQNYLIISSEEYQERFDYLKEVMFNRHPEASEKQLKLWTQRAVDKRYICETDPILKEIIDPEKDGIDHINIYSKGKTELGKMLSNFYKCEIKTEEGIFNSIEGYWYYLGTNHHKKENLKKYYGFLAKQTGKEYKKKSKVKCDNFEEKIKLAINYKIENNENLKSLFFSSGLPFKHYYVYDLNTVFEVKDCNWILEYLEELRKTNYGT